MIPRWELYAERKELRALDRYLELLGIDNGDWKKLPKKFPQSNR